jgi:hypothetical protein
MKQLYKSTLKYFSAGTLTAAFSVIFSSLSGKSTDSHVSVHFFDSPLTASSDTTKPLLRGDSLRKLISTTRDSIDAHNLRDTLPKQKIDTFSFKVSKDSLDAPVKYEAEDSAVIVVGDKKIYLYGKTKTDYKDISLRAPQVEIDQQTQIMTAVNRRDSTGEIIERAHFKQGDNEFESDTIRFNFKTQKGLTKNTYTNQNGIFFKSEYSKKVSASTLYAKNGVMTTCDLDDPHFGFHYNRIKVINSKLAVSGAIYPEFEGVPIPIPLPFGIFPLTRGRHSGFIPPQPTTNDTYGVGLEGLGYYKVINQNLDVKFLSNIYSYGGWSFSVTPTYRRRYKYSGAFGFNMQTTKINFKGDPDYAKDVSYFVNWNHMADSRARPGTSFSANVSAGSTKYNRYVPNSPQLNFTNQLASSIAYSKTWAGKPYNLTITANHNQNNQLRLIQVNLPDVGFTVSTLYPLQKKEQIGQPKWYEKIGIGYNGTFRNQFSFYDSAFSFKKLIDTLQWGAQHNIPISISLPPLLGGALMISPGVSFQQLWIAQAMHRTWNPNTKKTDTTVTKGFYMDNNTSFSLSLSTAIFGTYQFKHSNLIAIRHVIRPSLSFSYKPDLSKNNFYDVQVDTAGHHYRFSKYEGSLYGYFPEGKFGGASFSLDNNLEMKKHSKKDSTAGGIKKIRLIDGYGFTVNYNFMADSFRLSPLNFYLRSSLFDKINITGSATVDPYNFDNRGFPVNRYVWQDGKFSLGRIKSASLSISTDFKSKPRDPKMEDQRKQQLQQQLNDPSLIGDQQRLLDYMRQNPSEFVDFNIPWHVSLGFTVFFSEQLKTDLTGFDKKFSSNLNINGGFNLTPKWNVSMNGYYDLDTRKIQTLQMNISREMHCWQMSLAVTPVGLYRSFSINISPKSSILQDLKINRTRYFSNY